MPKEIAEALLYMFAARGGVEALLLIISPQACSQAEPPFTQSLSVTRFTGALGR